jgi:hypothetical protein
MKINKLLLGLLALSLGLFVMDRSATGVHAYNTYMATLFPGDVAVNGDIKVIGGDLLDSAETTRLTLGATNAFTGDLTVSGAFTPTGALTNTTYEQMYTRTSAQIKVTTPTASGLEVFDTTLKQPVYSTGTTTCFDWVTSTGTRPAGY